MDPVTVLVTGGGAPGIAGTIWSLRHNWDARPLRIVCVDAAEDVVGRYLADACHTVPAARAPDFIAAVVAVCERERVDVILPQVTAELPVFARHKRALDSAGFRVAVSAADAIERTNDKHALAAHARALGVAVPDDVLVSSFGELERAARELGYPSVPVAVKQPCGNGMRGYRALFATLDRKRLFYEQKPDSSQCTLEELHAILGDRFPALMVMEYLPGLEYTVDVLCSSGQLQVAVPRERLQVRTGITFRSRTVEHAQIIRDSTSLAQALGLDYAFGFQFKEDARGVAKLLECNPRVQGTMVAASVAGANVIYGAVKLALGEALPAFSVRWGSVFQRYWGGVAAHGDEVVRL